MYSGFQLSITIIVSLLILVNISAMQTAEAHGGAGGPGHEQLERIIIIQNAYADSSNPNLFVSAENSKFENHFEGSMVIEVIVNDPNLHDTDEGKGEPDVTLNGKNLRMVQATDGSWYAYFANLDRAKIADQISFDSGVIGVGLDFGVFCSNDTPQSVFGVSFSDTQGIAVPRSTGIAGFTNGIFSFTPCSGSPASSLSLNNVVREPKSINTNSAVLSGQIGLDPDTWPVIQLFSFDDVVIQYNRAGGSQRVELNYDEIPNVLLNLDRTGYPKNAEVFVTVNDFQLNQDPTDEDSWTFNVVSPQATFYQAFDENGANSANGGSGLVNLIPHLSNLGFEDNGKLTLSLGNVGELGTNNDQPSISVTDGTNTFAQIVTLVESEPNSGIFENFDFDDKSTITISAEAPRGQSAVITYNSKSTSIISGTFSASLSIGEKTTKVEVAPAWNATDIDPYSGITTPSSVEIDPVYGIDTEFIMECSTWYESYQLTSKSEFILVWGKGAVQCYDMLDTWDGKLFLWNNEGLISNNELENAISYLIQKGVITFS